MNAKDIEEFQDMKRTVKTSAKILTDISICLMGKPDDRDDLGLVGDVRNNKRWKNNVNKTLGGLGLGFVSLFVRQLFEIFKR